MKKQLSFDGFEPANTTPVPDVLFDELLPYLSEAELKVLLYIIRRTSGFKKTDDAISLSQFQNGIMKRNGEILDRGCGVKNRTSINNALASLEKKGCIQSVKGDDPQGDKATTVYRVHFNSEGVVRQTYYRSTANALPVVSETYYGSTQDALGVVRETYLQETVIQETDSQETVIQESTKVATSAEGRNAPAENVSDFTEWKRKTDPHLPAVTSDTAYHIATSSGYEKDDAHADTLQPRGNTLASLPHLPSHTRQVLDDEPTEKRQVVKIGANNGSDDTSSLGNDRRASSRVDTSASGETLISEQTPAASVSLSLAVAPRGGQDDTRGRQAHLSVSPLGDAAQRTASPPGNRTARNGAVQASVIPKRPLRKVVIEKPQLTFAGQQLREWYECARECKVRMTDKNVITLNRLADIDEMTQENLKDVLEMYDKDKWMIEHNVMVDLQELEKQDGKFTFERGLLAVKRKRRANAPAQNGKADVYGNDYSLTAQLARQQKAM